jgi:hypothetical protein
MGKSKSGDKNLGDNEGENPTLVTREELEQLSMDMQKKLDDFALGQIELSKQQSASSLEFNKRFDHLTTLLSNLNLSTTALRPDAGASTHQSSVHGHGDALNGSTHPTEPAEASWATPPDAAGIPRV